MTRDIYHLYVGNSINQENVFKRVNFFFFQNIFFYECEKILHRLELIYNKKYFTIAKIYFEGIENGGKSNREH